MNISRDLGIDLGSTNVRIYLRGHGLVVREPAVVAVEKSTGKLLQVGKSAKNMLGRTPGNIVALRPLEHGTVSDYEMTEKMLIQLVKKAVRFAVVKPRVIVSVPSDITEVEERAVIQAVMGAGARRVYLMEEPLAAAIGAGVDISGPGGNLVVDIGSGTTDVAVLTMGDIAVSGSTKVAGNAFDEQLTRYLRKRHGLIVAMEEAENLKMTIGGVWPRAQEISMVAKGRDAKNGLPREVMITSTEVAETFQRPARQIFDQIMAVMDKATPELVSDIGTNGMTLTGGGALLYGLDKYLSERMGLACTVANDPITAVAIGCGKSLRLLSEMQEGTINVARKRLLKD